VSLTASELRAASGSSRRTLAGDDCGAHPAGIWRSIAAVERVTGIGGVFQRAAGPAAGLRDWYVEHLGIQVSEWGTKPFEWSPGGSTTWAVFEHDSEYLGRPEQAFMVNFRVSDLDAMLTQLRAAGVEVVDALDESEYGRFGWAIDPEGTRFELWEPPPGG
jgi:predicted enzyme related to lactoylglutathione lyase